MESLIARNQVGVLGVKTENISLKYFRWLPDFSADVKTLAHLQSLTYQTVLYTAVFLFFAFQEVINVV